MEIRRELERIPFDKRFELPNGNEELCHSTGYEVCDGDPNAPGNWWNEYEDSDGNLYYGR